MDNNIYFLKIVIAFLLFLGWPLSSMCQGVIDISADHSIYYDTQYKFREYLKNKMYGKSLKLYSKYEKLAWRAGCISGCNSKVDGLDLYQKLMLEGEFDAGGTLLVKIMNRSKKKCTINVFGLDYYKKVDAYFLNSMSNIEDGNDGEVLVPYNRIKLLIEGYKYALEYSHINEKQRRYLLGQILIISSENTKSKLLDQYFKYDIKILVSLVRKNEIAVGIIMAELLEAVKTGWVSHRRKEILDSILPPIPYPNILDSLENQYYNANDIEEFIKRLDKSISIDYLMNYNSSVSHSIYNKSRSHQDALLNSILYSDHPYKNKLLTALVKITGLSENFLFQQQVRNELIGNSVRITKSKDNQKRQSIESSLNYKRLPIGTYNFDDELASFSKKSLKKFRSEVAKKWTPHEPPNFSILPSKLKSDEAIVRIHRFLFRTSGEWIPEVRYAASVILPNPEKLQIIELPGGDSLELEFFDDYHREVYSEATGISYDRYWKPLEKLLIGKKRIFLITDGVYSNLNTSLFFDVNNSTFLCQKLNIIHTSSLESVFDNLDFFPNPGKALLVGDPSFSLPQKGNLKNEEEISFFRLGSRDSSGRLIWPSLPYSSVEVDSVAQMLKQASFKVHTLKGENANKSNVIRKSKDVTILHLATHAFSTPFSEKLGTFNNSRPKKPTGNSHSEVGNYVYKLRIYNRKERKSDQLIDSSRIDKILADGILNTISMIYGDKSGVVLSGANNTGNIRSKVLFLNDFKKVNLASADLIVLSACNIGSENFDMYSRLFGNFTHLFRVKGVKYSITSIRPIGDENGMLFITNFYRNWLVQKCTIDEAFSKAQRQMLDSGARTSTWSGFVLRKL